MKRPLKTAAVILAAGASRRMGTPKQLLRYQGETLIGRVVKAALAAEARPVVVVLGAYAELIRAELNEEEVAVVINAQWQKGMGSSVAVGINYLVENSPETEAALFLLVDQPFVTPALLKELIAAGSPAGVPGAVSQYNGASGAPAFFKRELFPALRQLEGDEGARQIIQKYGELIARVPFPQGGVDFDEPGDLLMGFG
jgi:molybdenum cofactor cytidylyltransferase